MFACEIRNPPNDWIQNPSSTDKTEIQHLESGIHGMKFSLQDCLGFYNMGGNTSPWTKLFVVTAHNLLTKD